MEQYVYGIDEIKEGYEETRSLAEDGLLFSEIFMETMCRREGPKAGGEGPVPSRAHDCNLRCTYCFAEEGEYHGNGA